MQLHGPCWCSPCCRPTRTTVRQHQNPPTPSDCRMEAFVALDNSLNLPRPTCHRTNSSALSAQQSYPVRRHLEAFVARFTAINLREILIRLYWGSVGKDRAAAHRRHAAQIALVFRLAAQTFRFRIFPDQPGVHDVGAHIRERLRAPRPALVARAARQPISQPDVPPQFFCKFVVGTRWTELGPILAHNSIFRRGAGMRNRIVPEGIGIIPTFLLQEARLVTLLLQEAGRRKRV